MTNAYLSSSYLYPSPIGIVSRRSKGGLIYSSKAFFRLVMLIEAAYVTNLTVVNLCMHGAGVVNAVHKAILNSSHICALFRLCCAGARVQAAAVNVDIGPKETELLEFILKKYLRLRGKDFVRSLVSVFKRRTDTAVSLRSKLGVMTATARAAPGVQDEATEEPIEEPIVEPLEAAADMDEEQQVERGGEGCVGGEGKADTMNADDDIVLDGSVDIGGALPLQ